ncbi:hypothetical protein OIB37_22585 [Streptomyces sp. NBC_00820]|uniref:hypothetical protein n=1 Tax=Streptomyces sp. NBC_00820 TaxID=2975842 RepID=UPI002ED42884|nr:hypothetical protein OIB37_22585 [Streptomyces sp. NBC_00820]
MARLPEELRELGRTLNRRETGTAGGDGMAEDAEDPAGAAGAETMVERVLAQILAEQLPVPAAEAPRARERLSAVRHWARLRSRSLVAVLCGLLAALALTPPVRAAVLDWFDFGGVAVRYDPETVPSPGAEVPGCGRTLSLAQATRRAGFEPLVPRALGRPDAVTVTPEPHGRLLVSLCWHERDHTVRLDEFPASLDPGFTKTVREPPQWLPLRAKPNDGTTDNALWFPRPHLLTFWLVDDDGHRFDRRARTAGPTLLWMRASGGAPGGAVTLRLEGVASRNQAVEIAKSLAEGPETSSK